MSGGLGNAALLAVIAVVPIVLLMMTSFVKISVVLSLVRNAIGAPDAPSGLVVTGLSLILTFFVMAPVAIEMTRAAAEPAAASAPAGASTPAGANAPAGASTPSGQPIDVESAVRSLLPPEYRPQVDAVARGLGPLRAFLTRHASARDRETFTALATRMDHAVAGDEIWVLAPAFVTTELREAFAIAVLVFVPFLIIDLVVGLGLASLGLMSTSPQTVALPLKLLLFVAVDGWRLLIDGLLRGYA
jgi:type III secretion protein R